MGKVINVFSERLNKYQARKVGEIAQAGANVIFERGLWSHRDRKELREYYKNNGVDCEIHYVCVDDETWKQNIAERNKRVKEGNGGSDFYLNEGLMKKLESFWEEPTKEEYDVLYKVDRIKKLSKELKKEYGKGFELRNLYYFLQFYKTFPNILHSVNAKSNILSWTHYKTLLQVEDEKARQWYEKETAQQTWSVRTLQRNISSQYYYRLLKSQVKQPVIEEMKEKNKEHYLVDKLEFIKNPLIAEFLGFSLEDTYTETELETSIINNLQKFLMELWKRICFC